MCTYTFGGGNQHNLSMVYRKRNMQQAQDISCTHKRCDSLTCIFRATNCGGSFLLPAVIQLIHWIRCTWEAHVCRTHGNPGHRYCTCQWTPNKQTIQMTVCGSTWCINWLTRTCRQSLAHSDRERNDVRQEISPWGSVPDESQMCEVVITISQQHV